MKNNCKHCMDTGTVTIYHFGVAVSEQCPYRKEEKQMCICGDSNCPGGCERPTQCEFCGRVNCCICEFCGGPSCKCRNLFGECVVQHYEKKFPDNFELAIEDIRSGAVESIKAIHSLTTAVEKVSARLSEIDSTFQGLTYEGGLAVQVFKQ